jgi:hypothetical protein
MTALEVIDEIDHLPLAERQAVFSHFRIMDAEPADESRWEKLTAGQREAEIKLRRIEAIRWLEERQLRRPILPGTVDAFIADRREDRA